MKSSILVQKTPKTTSHILLRSLLGLIALVAVVTFAGGAYLWMRANDSLKPSNYRPSKPLLSYADEAAPAVAAKTHDIPFDWDTIEAPPRTSMPWIRWWWPGADVEPGELAHELQQLHDANFGGAEIQAFSSGTDDIIQSDIALRERVYAVDSPSYLASVRDALAEAQRLGLQIDLTHYSGWPGASPAVASEDGLQNLTWSVSSFRGGRQVEIALERPAPHVNALIDGVLNYIGDAGFAEFDPSAAKFVSALVARPLGGSDAAFSPLGPLRLDASSVQVVDAHVRNGRLIWNAPPGRWVLVASWLVPAGESPISGAFASKAYTVNTVDAQRVRAHYDYVFGARTGYAQFYGGTLRGIFNDSVEFTVDRLGAVDILGEFRKRRGYDLRPFLPVIYVDAIDNTYFGKLLNAHPRFKLTEQDARIRYDYQLTLSDLIIERFYRTSHDWARERGLLSRAQPYGFDMDVIRAEGVTDIPETEQLESRGAATFLRAASSAGMLYGHDIISAESLGFQGAEYTTNPAKMKASADLLFLNGVNQLVYHGFPYDWRPAQHADRIGPQGWHPFVGKFTTGFTFAENYSPQAPLWADMKEFNTYVGRAQNLLRQGKQEADVLIYYPAFGIATPIIPKQPSRPLQDGHFPLSDPSSGFVQMPSSQPDRDALVQWLEKVRPILDELDRRGLTWRWVNGDALCHQLTPAGKTLGGAPYGAIVFAETEASTVKDIVAAERLAAAGRPVFLIGKTPTQQLGYFNAAAGDASISTSIKHLTQIHPAASSSQNLVESIAATIHPSVAFVTPSDLRHEQRVLDTGYIDFFANLTDEQKRVALRVTGPGETWWFDAMTGATAAVGRDTNGDILLTLRPYESRFLIRGVKIPAVLQRHGTTPLLSLSTPERSWTLPRWKITAESVVRDGPLFDWRNDKDLRYSAAQATYITTLGGFQPRKNARYLLSVGLVPGVASIRINNQDAGSGSLPPGDVDITPYLHDGSNAIEILYCPSPRNAQIGLALAGNKSVAYLKSNRKALIPAGLTSPITLSELILSGKRQKLNHRTH